MKKEFYCTVCKQTKPTQTSGGTGYATKRNGHKVCYQCCADTDKKYMAEHGEISLYLAETQHETWNHYEVTNWPGTLRFAVDHIRTGRHNIAGEQTSVWFTGPDGAKWYGRQVGSFSQICRCKRLKK
jgi:hypothetical protein